jgi:5-methylcytosine-specific restriction enzyme subunit McrC
LKRITAIEGQPVPLPDAGERRELAFRFYRAGLGETPAFALRRGALVCEPVVGAVSVGPYDIELLPKTARASESPRDLAINLICAARYAPTQSLQGRIFEHGASLADVLYGMVVDEISIALRDGSPRRYSLVSEESAVLRGRVEFQRLFRRMPGGTPTVPVSHYPLSLNNELSKLLKWLTSALSQRVHSAALRSRLAVLQEQLGPVPDEAFNSHRVEKIRLAATERRFSRVLEVAKLVARDLGVDPTRPGGTELFSIVLPLNRLFEAALARVLAYTLGGVGLTLQRKTQTAYLLEDLASGEGVTRLRPDYVISRDSSPVALGDAKWKRLEPGARPSAADLYQLHAYLARYAVPKAFLFYPASSIVLPGKLTDLRVPGTGSSIHVISVDTERLVSRNSVEAENAARDLRAVVCSCL